jgi:serine phosphatase RsbU (regulator of sigma subunit)
MDETKPDWLDSDAYARALLEHELLRVKGLLGVLAALCVLLALRVVTSAEPGAEVALLRLGILLLVMIAYEAFVFWRVKSASRDGAALPAWFWTLNIAIETIFPSAGIVLTGLTLDDVARSLYAPPVILYFFFIILSILRLRPRLTFLSGVVSAVGYVAALYILRWNLGVMDASQRAIAWTTGLLLLVGGAIAAVVAQRIRHHFAGAQREADTRNRLELVHQDLRTARTIQQGLLPKSTPQMANYEFAGWNLPADETGGDYYDFQVLPGGKTVVTLADVSGHGIGPAMVMASCRSYARMSMSADPHLSPHFNRMNEQLTADLPAAKFVTAVAAVVDDSSSDVQLLSAGHGPILHYVRRDQKLSESGPDGMPLGMFAKARYDESRTLKMEPGDLLIFVTDGFLEWEDPKGEQFGTERLEKVVRESGDIAPELLIQEMYHAVLAFCQGTKQMDDLTAVIIRRKLPA